MEAQTETTTERVDIANDDLIDVITSLIEYEKTNGSNGARPRLDIVGDGPNKMAVPAKTATESTATICGTQLVEDGDVADTVEIDGNDASVQVL